VFGIEHRIASVRHPQTVGAVERFHRELKRGLSKTIIRSKSEAYWMECSWCKEISTIVAAYNRRESRATRSSPFELMFGRKDSLPGVEALLKVHWDVPRSAIETSEYISDRLRILHDDVRKRQQEYLRSRVA
jgi:hypothetical protein